MSESRNTVIVTGIPGVGKTTVINSAMELVKEKHGEDVLLLNFGTEMFEGGSYRQQPKEKSREKQANQSPRKPNPSE
jgi:adenylate kinase